MPIKVCHDITHGSSEPWFGLMQLKTCTFTNQPVLLFHVVCSMFCECLNVHSIWKEWICQQLMYLIKIMNFCFLLRIFWCISLKTNSMYLKLYENDLIHHINFLWRFLLYKCLFDKILIYACMVIIWLEFVVTSLMVPVNNELF